MAEAHLLEPPSADDVLSSPALKQGGGARPIQQGVGIPDVLNTASLKLPEDGYDRTNKAGEQYHYDPATGWSDPAKKTAAARPPTSAILPRQELTNLAQYYFGVPAHVAEGIVDSIMRESGGNPMSPPHDDNGAPSAGLFQHHADRLTKLQAFAAQQGKPWTDPHIQFAFAAQEWQGGDAIAAQHYAELKAAPDRATAQRINDQYFERGAGMGGGGAGGTSGHPGDEAFYKGQAEQRAGIADLDKQMQSLKSELGKSTPGSEERHKLLDRLMHRSEEMSERYDKLSRQAPQAQSPFEAMNEWAPLMIGIMSLAGTFTKRPALGSINAASAALGALKEGNDANYKLAFDNWSKQADLAHTAFKMQNDEIRNVMDNMQLSESERQNEMTNRFRFLGMTDNLRLAKAGMWKEVYDRQTGAQKLEDDHQEKLARIEKERAEARKADAQSKLGSSTNPVIINYQKSRAAFVEENRREPTSVEDQKIYNDAHKNWVQSGEEGKAAAKPEQRYVDLSTTQYAASIGKTPAEMTSEEKLHAEDEGRRHWVKAVAEGRAEGGKQTANEMTYRAIAKRMMEQNRAAGRAAELTPAQDEAARKEVITFHHNIGLTGNRRNDIQNQVDQLGYSLQTIDDTFDLMTKYGMLSGIGGKLTRPAEAVGNILGAYGETAKADFQSHLEYLRMTGTRILSMTTGRPLSGEEKRIDTIIRGLNIGDTSQRTLESMNELRQLYTDMRHQHESQLDGTWKPIQVPEAPTTRSPYSRQPEAAPSQTSPQAAPPTPPPNSSGQWWHGYDAVGP